MEADPETHVLAALVYAEDVDAILELPEAAFRSDRRVIFRRAVELRRSGVMPTLAQLEEADKRVQVARLVKALPGLVLAPAETEAQVTSVRSAYRRGVVVAALAGLIRETETLPPGEVITRGADTFGDLAAKFEERRRNIVSSVEIAMRVEERWKNPPEKEPGIPPPFQSWLPHFLPGRLYVVGGRTANGKTVLAIQIMQKACEVGAYVGLASIEMSAEDIGDRIVAAYGVPYSQVRRGRVYKDYEPFLRIALQKCSKARFDVIDEPEVRASTLRTLVKTRKYDMLIVDHLHRVALGARPDEYRQALEAEVRAFTTIARDQNIPVVLLVQLRRMDGKSNPRPSLSDLRDTEVIAQEAAVVYATWIEANEDGSQGTTAALSVLKNRFGSLGSLDLRFKPSMVRFELGP